MKSKKDSELLPHELHCTKLVEKFIPHLYLHEYSWTGVWAIQPGYEGSLAHINIDFKYLNFTIFFDGKTIKKDYLDGKSYKLANMVMHELCHIHTAPLWRLVEVRSGAVEELQKEIWERQTQRLANVVLGLIPRRQWEIKKSA